MAKKQQKLKAVEQKRLLKLDLGCGPNKREGFLGVDCRDFKGVDQVVDLAELDPTGREHGIIAYKNWPWDNDSVEEVYTSHFVEHLTSEQRIHFVNELYRVLIPGGKCLLITPHWASCRAYGDLTHKWPPVSEFWFYYLSKEWRAVNAPHNDGYACDFEVTWAYTMHPSLVSRNQEYQMQALGFWKEAAQDTIATLTKR